MDEEEIAASTSGGKNDIASGGARASVWCSGGRDDGCASSSQLRRDKSNALEPKLISTLTGGS
jgi:hypothetical protein